MVTRTEIFAVSAVLIALGCLISWVTVQERQQAGLWQKFQQENACRKVSVITGETVITVPTGVGGQVGIGRTADKEGWLCSDGVTYYR